MDWIVVGMQLSMFVLFQAAFLLGVWACSHQASVEWVERFVEFAKVSSRFHIGAIVAAGLSILSLGVCNVLFVAESTRKEKEESAK